MLRGAFGMLALPLPGPAQAADMPSGLADPPRPFVFRAAHLDGRTFNPGEVFAVGIHIFDLRQLDLHQPMVSIFKNAFAELARTGLGPGRARVELLPAAASEVQTVDLSAPDAAKAATVFFRTPTELKGNPVPDQIPFGVLFARVRDRIATLSNLYGEGPLPVDFKSMGDRAALVRTVRSELQYSDIMRKSSRTGQTHGIGGFTGSADYEGELSEFVPWLKAAWWTGVGRHTVWGNGVIDCVVE